MIAADTSTWVAYLEGGQGEDVELLENALKDGQVLMAPVVLTELLSDPSVAPEGAKTLSDVPLIDIAPGYWQRAGKLRARVLAKRRKARRRANCVVLSRPAHLTNYAGSRFPHVCRNCGATYDIGMKNPDALRSHVDEKCRPNCQSC